MKKIIFVDTDAFVAFVRKADSNHKKAKRIVQKLKLLDITFFTTNYVFSESVTVISQRVSHAVALSYIDAMKSSESPYTIHVIDEALEKTAITIFKQQTSKNTSFVDCTNMACMKLLQVDAIFSFDEVYKKQGFTLIEKLVLPKK